MPRKESTEPEQLWLNWIAQSIRDCLGFLQPSTSWSLYRIKDKKKRYIIKAKAKFFYPPSRARLYHKKNPRTVGKIRNTYKSVKKAKNTDLSNIFNHDTRYDSKRH